MDEYIVSFRYHGRMFALYQSVLLIRHNADTLISSITLNMHFK